MFALCKKKDEKRLKRNNKDIEILAHSAQTDTLLAPDFVVFQDSPELEREILTADIAAKIIENRSSIQSIHITDHFVSAPALSQKSVRLQVLLSRDHFDNLAGITSLACMLVDQVAKIRLTKGSKKAALEKRQILKEQLLKLTQEDKQERIREERRRREEAANAELSKAALKKKEEKELKKSLKKRNNSKRIVLR